MVTSMNASVLANIQNNVRISIFESTSRTTECLGMNTLSFTPVTSLEACIIRLDEKIKVSFRRLLFLQRVSIACYAERCISYDRFCPSL